MKIHTVIVLAILCAPGLALATLIGDEVTCSMQGNLSCNAATATVGIGEEFSVDFDSLSILGIDIGAASIGLTQRTSGVWGSGDVLTIGDLDWTDMPGIITGVMLTGGIGSLLLSDISFTDDSVTIDFSNASIASIGQVASITLETRHVPEPTTIALLSLGLAGLGFTRRRMKV